MALMFSLDAVMTHLTGKAILVQGVPQSTRTHISTLHIQRNC